jgi:predicted peptidase
VKKLNFKDFGFYKLTGAAKLRMPYRLLAPRNVTSGARYPLVLFLHGLGEQGHDNKRHLANGVERFATPDAQAQHPCFVLVPQCPSRVRDKPTMWNGDREKMHSVKDTADIAIPLQTALEILSIVQEKNPVDRDRIYITGVSMGGFATWETISRHPRTFAAAIPVCGGGDINYAERIKDIPIWAFHSGNDPIIEVGYSKSMIEAVEKAGGYPRYTEYPGIGHNCWDQVYAEPDLLSWLFSKSRAQIGSVKQPIP